MKRYLAIFTCLIAAAGTATAIAHTTGFNSATTIALRAGPNDSFTGRVSSPLPGCLRGRLVKLYNLNPGYTGTTIYRTRTNLNGKWTVGLNGHAYPGSWYAIVTVKRITPTGHNHLCRGARSRTITIHAPGGGGGHDG